MQETWLAAFPLGDPLSSADSATGVPVLFARFAGTMGPSDFLLAFMSALPSVTFSDRSAEQANIPPYLEETNRISRFSRLEFSRMHRFSDSAVLGRDLPYRRARYCLPIAALRRRTK